LKTKAPASTHKKVVLVLADKKSLRGYLNPVQLGQSNPIDVLTPDGEHVQFPLAKIRAIYFVREFSEEFEPQRKAFLSRPKLDGLWVRLRFHSPAFSTNKTKCLYFLWSARSDASLSGSL
jgi:uncharacterized protein DUF6982